ncbi:hypothetical protein ILUMI_16392 [Ignelater luminosus]|uniref:Uncharacterized protein n=1 Tax=Ignelater luminosus TaxID=2038154 RepID=A0A8K0CUI2_IGNLU|nr:hypothetical protein ILUMI_16392 [Ignelater luminosus]
MRNVGSKSNKKENNGYVWTTNEEIYDIFIKTKRLQWLGHVERMQENRTVKKLAWKDPDYKKKRVRPRKRWREAILEDMQEKGFTEWKKKAKDKKDWRRITKP